MHPKELVASAQNGLSDLDPADWSALRALGHRMLDDMLDHLSGLRDGPVWQPMPDALRDETREALPRAPQGAEAAYDAFRRLVLPYATGNLHPRFMGWVHGGGTAVGGLAELLAGMLNANLGGRDHAPIEIERQVIRWAAEMLGLPESSSGLLVTGTSIANLIGVLVARTDALGRLSRRHGLAGAHLAAYTSEAAHGCITRAMEMTGIGSDQLRLIPVHDDHRIDADALEAAIARDKAAGHTPVPGGGHRRHRGCRRDRRPGPVGDDLRSGRPLVPRRWRLRGAGAAGARAGAARSAASSARTRSHSIFTNGARCPTTPAASWCATRRSRLAAFAQHAAYLRRETRGLAGGHPWPCDLGPDLSRGLSRAESVDDAEDIRRGCDRRGRGAQLRHRAAPRRAGWLANRRWSCWRRWR